MVAQSSGLSRPSPLLFARVLVLYRAGSVVAALEISSWASSECQVFIDAT